MEFGNCSRYLLQFTTKGCMMNISYLRLFTVTLFVFHA